MRAFSLSQLFEAVNGILADLRMTGGFDREPRKACVSAHRSVLSPTVLFWENVQLLRCRANMSAET